MKRRGYAVWPKFPGFVFRKVPENLSLEGQNLSQASHVTVKKDVIYGQLHEVYGKTGTYGKTYMGESQFMFS